MFKRKITRDDIIHLTEIKIKRISKYDILKQINQINKIKDEITLSNYNIKEIKSYSINYLKSFKKIW